MKISAIVIFLFFSIVVEAWGTSTIDLPRTGQTYCYDKSGNEIWCPSTGQDGDIRAGAIWPDTRFTIGTGTEADCVTDNLTGLMWSRNADLPKGAMNWSEALNYIAFINSGAGLCGYADWRLPNIIEFESLFHADMLEPAWLEWSGFFNVQPESYWSSSTFAYDVNSAWFIYMNDGNIYHFKKSQGNYVWPLRGGQAGLEKSGTWKTGQTQSYESGDDGDLQKGIAWPDPRFTASLGARSGCITDNLTGLMWPAKKNVFNETKTWQQALNYTNDLTLCGYSDWRLPNRKEFISLIDFSKVNPALPGGPFIETSAVEFWSSSTYANEPEKAWLVSINDGAVYDSLKLLKYDVWPVRSQQSDTVSLIVVKAGTGEGIFSSKNSNCTGYSCIGTYKIGTTVDLIADSSNGSIFSGWSGCDSVTGNQCTITMTADKDVMVTFTKLYSLSIAVSGNGTVTNEDKSIFCTGNLNLTKSSIPPPSVIMPPSQPPPPPPLLPPPVLKKCSGIYSDNTEITLSATPMAGSVFVGWSGGNCSGSDQCIVKINENTLITATFVVPYALTVSVSGSGTVSTSFGALSWNDNTGSAAYASGTSLTLTATPSPHSSFVKWTGCDSISGNTCDVSMTAAKTVKATFITDRKYKLTVTKTGTGIGAVTSDVAGINCPGDCSEQYWQNDEVTLTATPVDKSIFSGWNGACTGIDTCQVTITEAKAVRAIFMPYPKLIVAKSGTGSGVITSDDNNIRCGNIDMPDCTETYTEVKDIILTAIPSEHSSITRWTGCTSSSGNICNVTMTAARTVRATFSKDPKYKLRVTQTGKGRGTITSNMTGITCPGDCSEYCWKNDVVTLTAEPSANSVFSGWSGACAGINTICQVRMTSARNVKANFAVSSK